MTQQVEHDPHLAHHFDNPRQQFESGKQGMWLFLATEILLFGGLFCAYAIYRKNFPEIFYWGHQYLSVKWGGINTIVLICSSLTMAWAVRAAQLGNNRVLIANLMATLLFACVFLGIKGVEYHEKWRHGLLWAREYKPTHHDPHGSTKSGEKQAEPHASAVPTATSPTTNASAPADNVLAADKTTIPPPAVPPQGTKLRIKVNHQLPFGGEPKLASVFFSIYFLMTGLHGLHVLLGMLAIGWLLYRSTRKHFTPSYFAPVDFVGLYWHLVDLIWIYLFPLLYLIH